MSKSTDLIVIEKIEHMFANNISFLNDKNDHSILFGIKNLKEYLKSKKIEIR